MTAILWLETNKNKGDKNIQIMFIFIQASSWTEAKADQEHKYTIIFVYQTVANTSVSGRIGGGGNYEIKLLFYKSVQSLCPLATSLLPTTPLTEIWAEGGRRPPPLGSFLKPKHGSLSRVGTITNF